MSKKVFNLQNNSENFGILLKGGSLDKLYKYKDKFNDCFIVSDYDDELNIIGDLLKNKNIIHFKNRSHNSSLTKTNYKRYSIKYIQLGQSFRWNHFKLLYSYLRYKFMYMGINISFLPEKLNTDFFGPQYKLKFPNTGILSILFTLNIIKPKNLWIFGLDFYHVDYFTKQIKNPDNRDLSDYRVKNEQLDLINYVINLFSENSDIKIHLASYYDKWPKLKNVNLI